MKRHRVLIADDHDIVIEGLRRSQVPLSNTFAKSRRRKLRAWNWETGSGRYFN